jgi:hypothetical protein
MQRLATDPLRQLLLCGNNSRVNNSEKFISIKEAKPKD